MIFYYLFCVYVIYRDVIVSPTVSSYSTSVVNNMLLCFQKFSNYCLMNETLRYYIGSDLESCRAKRSGVQSSWEREGTRDMKVSNTMQCSAVQCTAVQCPNQLLQIFTVKRSQMESGLQSVSALSDSTFKIWDLGLGSRCCSLEPISRDPQRWTCLLDTHNSYSCPSTAQG